MQQPAEACRTPLFGAAIATVAGLTFGFGLKAEVDPASSFGTQLQVSKPTDRARGAFDDWFPAEAAPPPAYQLAQLRQEDGETVAEIDHQIARLLETRRADYDRVAYAPEPVQAGRYDSEPEAYMPTYRGDILAASHYEPPPADVPRWGWALPGEGAPTPAGAPPQIYEDGAAG